MANSTASAVELMIVQWLDSKQFLLYPILDQLAKELAPIVAEQAIAELKTRLAGLQTRDDLVEQLVEVILEVKRFFGGEWGIGDEGTMENGDRLYEQAKEALIAVDVYRGLNPPPAKQAIASQAVADDVEEGGAE